MWFCLSSGARPRYLDDVVRALALPTGTELVFRYEKKYLSEEALNFVEGKAAKKEDLIIAYLDRASVFYTPFIIPCRQVRIAETSDHGPILTIIFRLGDFAYAGNLEEFQEKARASAPKLPYWENGKLSGSFFLKVPEIPLELRKWEDRYAWHDVVKQLSARSEFEKKTIFPQLLGLKKKGSTKYLEINTRQQVVRLKPNREYLLDLYHFHPTEEARGHTISVKSSRDDVLRIISPTTLMVDSRYDQKRFRCRTGSNASKQATTLLIDVVNANNVLDYEFELPVIVRGSWGKALVRSVVIGVFVAAPAIMATVISDKASLASVLLMLGLGLCAGLASTYLLPRAP